MSTEDIKIDIKEEPLFDDKIFDEQSEWKTIVKSELDSKLIKQHSSYNSQNVKCEEDFCVKEEELDCPLDLRSADIEVGSMCEYKYVIFITINIIRKDN